MRFMYTLIQKATRILHITDSLFEIQNAIYATSFDIDLLLCTKIIYNCVILQSECRLHRFVIEFSFTYELQNFALLFYFILALFNKYILIAINIVEVQKLHFNPQIILFKYLNVSCKILL